MAAQNGVKPCVVCGDDFAPRSNTCRNCSLARAEQGAPTGTDVLVKNVRRSLTQKVRERTVGLPADVIIYVRKFVSALT